MSERHLHFRPGTLLAVVETKNPGAEFQAHLQACDACMNAFKLFQSLTDRGSLRTEPLDSAYSEHVCPRTDEETALFLLKFLRNGLPEDLALPFYKHLNNCQDCREIFWVNWAAYCDAKSSAKNEDDNEKN